MKNTLLFTCMIMLSFSLVGQNYNLETYSVGISDVNKITFTGDNWTYSINDSNFYQFTVDSTSMTGSRKGAEELIIKYLQQTPYTIDVVKEFSNNELQYGDVKITIAFQSYLANQLSLSYIDNNNNVVSIGTQTMVSSGLNHEFIFNKPIGINITKLKISINGTHDGTISPDIYELRGLKIEVDQTTNIQENIANNFNVYSYNKNLVVKTTALENYNIRIYNLSGQEILVKNAQGNQEIPLTLATGMYIVNINNGKESYNQKVVVQ